jgi:hypothetical protein
MKNNRKNIDHTIPLLSLESIESVRKLAIAPISIATEIVIEIQLGFPRRKRSTR